MDYNNSFCVYSSFPLPPSGQTKSANVLICVKIAFHGKDLAGMRSKDTTDSLTRQYMCIIPSPDSPWSWSATVAFPDEETWSRGSCGCQAAHGSLALPSTVLCWSSEGCVALLCSWECLQKLCLNRCSYPESFVLTWLSFITELGSAHFNGPSVECTVEGSEPDGHERPL